MSRDHRAADCIDLAFPAACALEAAAQVALEDYARVLSGAAVADCHETAPGVVAGVHLCGMPAPPGPEVVRDIDDFARELAAASSSGGGLGWS